MNELIVTADDVGLHPDMTAGAIEAHQHGIVTACSVSACETSPDETARALEQTPHMDVGAHLTLVEERPVMSPSRIPSLVNRQGMFHRNYRQFAARYFTGRIDAGEVEIELRAQLERLRSSGFDLAHVNSHQHLHVLPALFRITVRLACEFGIPYIRTVDEHGSGGTLARRLAIRSLSLLGRQADPEGLVTSDHTIGIFDAGHLTAPKLIDLFSHVDGLTELIVHPGVNDANLSREYAWNYEWEEETRALCDPSVRRALEERAIGLRGTSRGSV